MSEEKYEFSIKRILVALDASTDSLAALQSAANLAAAMEAELVGLFVEDINLLRLAGLPFAREVQRATGAGRTLDETSMERDLQLQASQARRALAEAAAGSGATWSFQVVRGVVQKEVVTAALEADLLSLGRTSRPLVRSLRLGSTARAVLSMPRSILLGHPSREAEEPIYVTFDGSLAGEKAVVAAARLAQFHGADLVVLLVRPDHGEGRPAAAQLAERGEALVHEVSSEVDIRYQDLAEASQEELIKAARQANCSLLVLGGEVPMLQGEALQQLLDELNCPVMLVR